MAKETTMTTGTIEAPVVEEAPLTEADEAAIKSAAFGEGFKGESTETPTEPEPVIEAVAEPVIEPVQEPVTPKLAQITEEQFADLLKMHGKMSKLDEGFGTLGNLKQRIEQLQASTTSGKPVEVTDEDMADLQAEFPEFADLTKKVLTKVVGKLRGTGTAPVDTEALLTQAEARAEARVFKRIQDEAAVDLLDEHPDFRTITGNYETRETAPTAFQSWVAKQPADFQKRLYDSNNASYLSKQITRFKTETAEKPKPAPTPKPNERTARLTASVTPKGVAPAGSPPEENSFSSGFRHAMKAMGQPV